ncbi:MAG: hypothetical protein HZB65_01635 [Candidatus Aenigmarchaeota archaeon]|nr:hypothetical protein [Candidatus Aenigmarchaeota archaeon]
MEMKKIAAIVIIVVLLVSTGALVAYMSITGRVAAEAKYQGYSSYEEMMEAHHGSASSGGCGLDENSVPANMSGEMLSYGITLDENGYNQLLKDDVEIKLSDEQMKNYVGLNILLPCCDVATLQASDNCQCGHHVAMSGIAKRMLMQDYSREQVQQEIDRWKEIFYPGGVQSIAGSCSA